MLNTLLGQHQIMYNIKAFVTRDGYGNLDPLSAKREWMDETHAAHAYKCFPVTLTNTLGWGISFPEDITFIWDGVSNSDPSHVTVLSGEKYVNTGRANGTISFETGLMFKTDKDVSLLTMPVPNLIRDGVQPLTTLISSSFFRGDLPCAWRITRPNVEITIKANTPVVSIIPISLGQLNNTEIEFAELSSLPAENFSSPDYSQHVYELNRKGEWSNFYRDAVDHLGNSIGEHEVKSLKLKVKK